MRGITQTDCQRTICLILLGWLLLYSPAVTEASQRIEKIEPIIRVSDGTVLPLQIVNRMQAGVQTIADNRLLGRNIELSDGTLKQEEYLIRDVFERILNGYTVQNVDITPGVNTSVVVTVTPWFNTIQQLEVKLQVDNVSPLINELIENDLSGLHSQLDGVMIGLPIDAVDWSYGIIKSIIEERMAAALPEYQASVEIISARYTTVKLNIYPKGRIIRHINNIFTSDTIPNILMLECRPYMQKKTEQLIGLPVDFVKRHQAFLAAKFNEQLQRENNLGKYDVNTHISFEIADNSIIRIAADTQLYRIALEGFMDVGHKNDNMRLKLHTGKMMNERWEYYLETNLKPHNMEWHFEPGLSYNLSNQARGGIRYTVTDSESVFWIKQKAGERWLWQLEYIPRRDESEVSLRYRLHEFIGVEYAVSSDKHLLRMVGYF